MNVGALVGGLTGAFVTGALVGGFTGAFVTGALVGGFTGAFETGDLVGAFVSRRHFSSVGDGKKPWSHSQSSKAL